MRKRVSTILLALASFTLLAFGPAMRFNIAFEQGVALPNEVTIGTSLNVAMVDIEHNGETKTATSCLVHTPSGAEINSTKISFSEPGKYIFEFSAMFGEEKVTKSLDTISVRTPVSMFSASNATVSQGSFAYNDKLDASVGVEDYKGVKVTSRDGGTVTFNKVLDFTNSTKTASFIDFIVEPSTLGAYDIGEIIVTLTDADDPNNKVDIRYVDGLAGSGNQMRLTYATARAAGQNYAGYENWSGQWHINNDQIGAATFLSLRGLDEQIINSFGVGYLNSQLFFDYSSKQILVKSEYTVVDSTVLINDLDNTNIYPTNPWSGFKNNRAILSITTKDVAGTGGKYIIKSIFGYDLSQDLLRDTEAPKLSIDFDGNDRNDLPLAKKNNTYPIFKADVFDNFDDDLLLKTNVQFYDKGSHTYMDIRNDGNRFTTSYYGEYLVSYYCSDRTGNIVQDSYKVNCSASVQDLVITVPEDSATHRAYDRVELCSMDDVIISNAQGRVTLKRYLIDPNGDATELTNDYFVPTTIGVYKVKYIVSDIYESPVTKIVDYNIQNIEHPIIVDSIILPAVMINGQYYDIPSVSCKYPSGNSIFDGMVDVYVNGVIFTEDKLHVTSLNDIVIDFVPQSSMEHKQSFTIRVVEGNDSDGKIIKSNYFYSEDSNYVVENIKNKAMQFTTNSESKINFIKSISSNDLSLSFGLDDETITNYDSFNIVIRDKNYPDNTVTLKVVPSGNSLKLYTPHESIPRELACDSNKQFELYYRPYNKALRDINYKDICQIKYFDNGAAFAGFSDEVYISFGFENLTNSSNVSLLFINNQSFKTSIVKDNAGPQIITDSNLNWANELGEEITIAKAKAYDVLSYVEYLSVTMTDSTGNKILNNADASKDYKVTLSKYGNYRIEYSSRDGNGRTSIRSYTICCIENEKPELTVNLTVKDEYAVGSIFTLPTYSFNDNSKNCTLDISLYLPSGQGIAIEHAEMRDGEIYKENYLDVDHYSSELVQSNNSIKLYKAGKYTLRYLVVDAYGNVNLQEFILNVR